MKRTPLARSQGPKRPLKRSTWNKRARLQSHGARAQRDELELTAFRETLWARIYCERCTSQGFPNIRGAHAHHMRRNPRVHDPALGALLCSQCHRDVHDHRAQDWANWFR